MARPPGVASPPSTAATLDLVRRAEDEIEAAGRDDLAARLRRERQRLAHPTCDVLVVGEFKKGKSALINALLNARICSVDADRFTAVPTVLRYGPRLRAHATPADDGAAEDDRPDDEAPTDLYAAVGGRDIDLADIRDVTTDIGDGAATGQVGSLLVELPRALLEDGLVLIDTPGVGGGLTGTHAAATLRSLSAANAVIFVTDASQELTAPEIDFLRVALRMCPTAVCAMMKTDLYPEWRRILDLDRRHLATAALDLDVLPLSAPLRHRAVRTGDDALDAASGFPDLAGWIRAEVLGQQERLAARAAGAAVADAVGQVVSRLETEREVLEDPNVERSLRTRLEGAKQRAGRLRTAAAEWQQILGDRFGEMTSAVDLDLTMRMRTVRDEMTALVHDGDPAETWPQLQAWINQRTNEQLVGHFARMREEADAVLDAVAGRFELEVAQLDLHHGLVQEPRTPGQAGDADETPEFGQMTRMQLAGAAVRGSTGSVVITGMVGTFMTFLAPLLTPGAAVLAAVLGRRSVRTAREAQLRANQAEATTQLRRFLEQAELLARKDSRDTMRRVHQRLRNFFRARAAEVQVTATEQLEATLRAVRADHGERKERLAEVDETLTRLRALVAEADAVRRGGA